MAIALFNDEGDLIVEQMEDDDNIALHFWQQQEVAYRRDLYEEDPHNERPFVQPPTRCILDVPFSHGTLAVSSSQVGAFDDDLGFLQQLASVLSEGFRRADDLKLLEERSAHLQREEHRQRTILETANEGFLRIDTHNRTVEVNDAMCAILGRTSDDVMGKSLFSLVDEENEAALHTEIARRKEGAIGAYEVSILRPDGSLVPCRINSTPLFDEQGHSLGSFAMVTDMSDVRSREQRESMLSRFREAVWALDSTSDVTDLLEPLRTILEASKIQSRVFGVNVIESADEERVCAYTTGIHDFRRVQLEPVHGRMVIEFWRGNRIENRTDLRQADELGELETWTDAHHSSPVSIVDVPFSHGTLAANSDEPNAFTEHLGLLSDIASILSEGFQRLDDLQALKDRTQRAEAAQQAAESANRSKSAFLANMSHEIRTPMNAILGFTEILNSSVTNPQHKDYVTSIQASGKTLLSLINDILDLSKVESGKLDLESRPADVHAVFRDLERLFGRRTQEKGIRLEIDIDDSLPPVLVIDEVRLRQIFVNLVSNAVKFTDHGHVRIHASASVEADGRVTIEARVEDTGQGIPADQHERIFGLFEQQEGQSINEYGGTGLGLAITRQLVQLMNGTVNLVSEPGKGSTFTIMLKDIEVAAAGALEFARPEGVDVDDYLFEVATVLVADDVPANRGLVKGFLSNFPFQLIEVENGEEAMAAVHRHRPDVVLMDIKMPVLDGFTASRRLKADVSVRDTPIVALTASVMRESDEEIAQVCDGLLANPVTRAQLVEELARFLPHEIRQREVEEVDSSAEGTAEELTSEQRARLPELRVALEAARPDWEVLRETLTINEVEDFAMEAQRLATEYDYRPLKSWGEKVASQATTFDMDGLAASMPEFLDLIDQLTKTNES